MRAAGHGEDFTGLRIHQNDSSLDRLELRKAGIQLLLDDGLDAHVDGELHVQSGARRLEAAGISRNHQPAGVAVMFARAIAACEELLHRRLDAEKPEHPGVGLALLVLFLNLAGEADEMGRQIRRGVPALDRVLELESLDPVGVDFLAQLVRDVFGKILGDGHPLALAVLDLVAEFLLAHAERPGENPDGVGEMLLHEDLRRFPG